MTTHSAQQRRPGARLRQLQSLRPTTPAQLHKFVETAFGLRLPAKRSDQDTPGPFDYLADSFFDRPGDAVVWANRGGGKTMLGAAATVLDLLFKPGIQVRILGGSLQQSEKMYEHLRRLLDQPVLSAGGGVLAKTPTQRKVVLQNGSRVELLSCSEQSVRGTRVQVLRCDEVDVMKRDVWDAAQLVTRSAVCGGRHVPGRIEALSTMHEVGGLMSELTDSEDRRLYRWNAMDVVARCPPPIKCGGCKVWDDCLGRAKQADGHLPVQDLIDQRTRLGDGLWDAEMMCKRPVTRSAVYPKFDPELFVEDAEPWYKQRDYDRSNQNTPKGWGVWYGGMDFGLRNETVVLWAWAVSRGPDAILHIAGDYIAKERILSDNLAAANAMARRHGLPELDRLDALAVDPAGKQRSSQTGRSEIDVLRQKGCTVRTPKAPVRLGIEAVLRRMDHGLLRIHPRCKGLILALQKYRYNPKRPNDENPLKEGSDHACDALRYLILAFDQGRDRVRRRGY
ncbi:MAG: hypothetical protein KTR15_14345 [Phycisphaeraceae bacterium]|nr:hypothetical protein [Phycisphaeraceae bacterium]